MKKVFLFIFNLFVLLFLGCYENDSMFDGEDDVSDFNTIKIISPTKNSVDYNFITLKVSGDFDDVIAIVNNKTYIGKHESLSSESLIKSNLEKVFYIYNLNLKEGINKIELIADGGRKKRIVYISSLGRGNPPIRLNLDLREGYEKLTTAINIETNMNAKKYLFDKDGDGYLDEIKYESNFKTSYQKEGKYFPQVTIECDDGTLYTTQKDTSIDIKSQPVIKEIANLSNLDIKDMQYSFDRKKYFILTNSAIYEINASNNDILNIIDINCNNPEGFFVDEDDNIFIANTDENKIIKFSKSNNYQETLTFGTEGSGNGELNKPKDLVVEGTAEDQKIYVLDSGNNRVQVFNYVGAYLYSFDGSNTSTGKLNNPTSMIGFFSQPLVIVDNGNGVIRTLQCVKGQKESEVSVIKENISPDIGKITMGNGDLIVPDMGTKKIMIFQNSFYLKKFFNLNTIPKIAISKDGINFITAYEGEKGVKEINLQIDPKGSQPLDVAKKFVNSLINGENDKVEKLLGYDQKNINFIFSDQNRLSNAINYYKQIISWSQKYINSNYAIVKAHIKTKNDDFDTTFELEVMDPQIKTKREWIIKRFY